MDAEDFKYVSDGVAHAGFFVEADSFARHALWKEYGFETDSRGFGINIGGTADTHLMFWFGYPNADDKEHTFCFYDATSQRVHWGEVDEFINKLRGARGKCDAKNFHNCAAWYGKK